MLYMEIRTKDINDNYCNYNTILVQGIEDFQRSYASNENGGLFFEIKMWPKKASRMSSWRAVIMEKKVEMTIPIAFYLNIWDNHHLISKAVVRLNLEFMKTME